MSPPLRNILFLPFSWSGLSTKAEILYKLTPNCSEFNLMHTRESLLTQNLSKQNLACLTHLCGIPFAMLREPQVQSAAPLYRFKPGHPQEAQHLFMEGSVNACALKSKGIYTIIALCLDIRNDYLFLTFNNFCTIIITLPVTIGFKLIYFSSL